MLTFATLDDFKEYSGIKEDPENIQFFINRANELVYFRVEHNYNANNPRHVEAVKNAVCAQVMFWVTANVSPVDISAHQGFTLGDLSVSSGKAEEVKPTSLCMLSLAYLRKEGLTYKGLGRGFMEQQV